MNTKSAPEAHDLLKLAADRPIVLFDGVCNLCNGAVDLLMRHDRAENFLFASLQSEAGRKLLQYHGLPTDEYESMVLLKKGRLYQRSTAALEIAASLGGMWKFFTIFRPLPASIRDAAYNFLARNRYRFFGKKETCRLPTAAERRRFLG